MQLRAEMMEHIRQVEPYVPGEQPQNKVVKLNTNENPYPPAPQVEEALHRMDTDRLRLYPDPAAEELTDALAKRYGVDKEQVFVGVGSDEGHCALAQPAMGDGGASLVELVGIAGPDLG